jgi:hypothetical protein
MSPEGILVPGAVVSCAALIRRASGRQLGMLAATWLVLCTGGCRGAENAGVGEGHSAMVAYSGLHSVSHLSRVGPVATERSRCGEPVVYAPGADTSLLTKAGVWSEATAKAIGRLCGRHAVAECAVSGDQSFAIAVLEGTDQSGRRVPRAIRRLDLREGSAGELLRLPEGTVRASVTISPTGAYACVALHREVPAVNRSIGSSSTVCELWVAAGPSWHAGPVDIRGPLDAARCLAERSGQRRQTWEGDDRLTATWWCSDRTYLLCIVAHSTVDAEGEATTAGALFIVAPESGRVSLADARRGEPPVLVTGGEQGLPPDTFSSRVAYLVWSRERAGGVRCLYRLGPGTAKLELVYSPPDSATVIGDIALAERERLLAFTTGSGAPGQNGEIRMARLPRGRPMLVVWTDHESGPGQLRQWSPDGRDLEFEYDGQLWSVGVPSDLAP